MGIRDWLAIIVIIFIVLILLDGFRRKWLDRKNRIRVKLDKNIPPANEDESADPLLRSELPNGGARTLHRADGTLIMDDELEEEVPVLMESVDLDEDEILEYPDDSENEQEEAIEISEQAEDNSSEYSDVDANVDRAMDFGEIGEQEIEVDPWNAPEHSLDTDDEEAIEDTIEVDGEGFEEEIEDVDSEQNREKTTFLGGRDNDADRIEPTFGDQELTFGRDDQGELNLDDNELIDSDNEETPENDAQEHAEEVIVINVMAKPGTAIEGKKLLSVLLKQGMRLGEMSIFHRHADIDGKGPVMFSMANMLKPGTFSMSEMEEFTTPGVSFFMQLPNRLGNMQCFEKMLKTAEAIQNEMDVLLKDENRSTFTRQTIEHSRQRIQDFELASLARK